MRKIALHIISTKILKWKYTRFNAPFPAGKKESWPNLNINPPNKF